MAKDRNGAKDPIDWLGYRAYPDWIRARWLGGLVGFLLLMAVPILFLLAIGAAVMLLFHAMTSGAEGASLGTGALIAALLGAPFVIWGTWLRHKTQRIEQEGHMTDRITKAVEQLGAEKTIKRGGNEETVPNLEVRIGAILSLERIAQDSTILDRGRDHVRVMEILCAYIRVNSNARKPVDFPFPDWDPLSDNTSAEAHAEELEWRNARFGDNQRSLARQWAQSLPKPRADVQLALSVIGRRTNEQRRVEAAWPDPPDSDTHWPFDTPCPKLPDETHVRARTKEDIIKLRKELEAWTATIHRYRGYQPDLSGANLQRADMAAKRLDGSDAIFSGIRLDYARMEGAFLFRARLEGTIFWRARLAGATFERARMEGAVLWRARMEGANAQGARLEGANLTGAQIQGAVLRSARMSEANLSHARVEGADLVRTRMEGVNFRSVQMDSFTDFSEASFQGARLRTVDFGSVMLTRRQARSAYGDASVKVPSSIAPPRHWPNWELPVYGRITYVSQWVSATAWPYAARLDG